MNPPTLHLGIDLAQDKFDVCLLTLEGLHHARFANTETGFDELLAWLQSRHATASRACMEATGKHGRALAAFLHRHQIALSVVNPLAIYYFARSQMSRNKTDPHDAHLIARYSQNYAPRLWQPRSPAHQQLQDWVRAREQLIHSRTAAQLRLQASAKSTQRLFAAQIRLLDKQIAGLDQQIAGLCAAPGPLQKPLTLLASIPGIGQTTAATLFATMPDLEELGGARQLAAFAGLTPRQAQSGLSAGKTRLCKLGHSRLRKALYFPALAALRSNPRAQALARRLAEKGKGKMVIIGAVMRLLLHLSYGVLKTQLPFDSNHLQARAQIKTSNRAAASPSSRPVAVK
jgi:transposase